MRTAITLAIHKGGERVEMIEGPLTPIEEQRAKFKQARQSRTHPTFERIELWESGTGRLVHHDYSDDPQIVAPIPPTETQPPPVTSEPAQDPAPEPQPVQEVEESADESQGDFEVSRKPRKRK